jgi:hypothetical protein
MSGAIKYMIKCILIYIPLTLLCFFSSACLAQSFFLDSSPQNTASQPNRSPGTNRVMSADEYKNMVNNLGKQNQDSLTQSAKDELGKQAPPIQPSIQPSQPAVINTPPSGQPSGYTSNPSIPTTQPSVVAAPPVTAAPPIMTKPIMTKPPVVAAPPSQPAVTPTARALQQPVQAIAPTQPVNVTPTQTYTGYGDFGKKTDTTNTNSTSGTSNGWNIKY